MKIGVSDPDNFTFSMQLVDHWRSLGHEVSKSLYHEERFTDEMDAVFYDFASMNVQELAKFGKKPKRCVVRAIDVENYEGYHEQFNYDLIDSFIFLNKSQYKMMKEKGFSCPENKVHIIQMGVDTNKFTFKEKSQENVTKICFIGRLWIGKNVLGALQFVDIWYKHHKNVELHILGDRFSPNWWRKLVEYKISQSPYKVDIINHVDSINEYLEDKDLLIVPSFKEAFSFVTAEAMAKGIPVINNNWYGSHDVWPSDMIYNDFEDAYLKAKNLIQQDPMLRRRYIEENYSQDLMFKKIDALMGVK